MFAQAKLEELIEEGYYDSYTFDCPAFSMYGESVGGYLGKIDFSDVKYDSEKKDRAQVTLLSPDVVVGLQTENYLVFIHGVRDKEYLLGRVFVEYANDDLGIPYEKGWEVMLEYVDITKTTSSFFALEGEQLFRHKIQDGNLVDTGDSKEINVEQTLRDAVEVLALYNVDRGLILRTNF